MPPGPPPRDDDQEPDIAEQDTMLLARIALVEAMRKNYAALYELHLAEAGRAQAQADTIAAAAVREVDPAVAEHLRSFVAVLREEARRHSAAALALINEQARTP